MRYALTLVVVLLTCIAGGHWAQAGPADGRLDVYWVDVEGGAATLIVTPAGESILVDTGWPGDRDAKRIADTLKGAGLKQIDHLIVTHYHIDHFGGAADLAKLVPIRNLYDNGIDPPPAEMPSKAYLELKVDKHTIMKPGDTIPLAAAPAGSSALAIRCLAARKVFVEPAADAKKTEGCEGARRKEEDKTENGQSIVLLVSFGRFRFFDGADLTWNMEEKLVCPVNLVGPVDVYQVTHHGMDLSNNPLVLAALAPTVAVMNNGARKGGSPEASATLKATASIQAIYQMHQSMVKNAINPADEFIANQKEPCDGNGIKLSVAADSATYSLSVPTTHHERTYRTKAER